MFLSAFSHSTASAMLLDDLMPVYDVVECHRTLVRATPAVVFRTIREADLAGGPIPRALLALRAIPAALVAAVRSPRALRAEWRARRDGRRNGIRLADFERAGFRVVAEQAPTELVISDKGICAAVLLWVASLVVIMYG